MIESARAVATLVTDDPRFSQAPQLQDARTALTHGFPLACVATDFRRDSYYDTIRGAVAFLEPERPDLHDDVNAGK